MSHYRDLNKELVEQVQTMRKNMKLYCDEIVYLKSELLEKHQTEVTLRKQCYNWAVNSFAQLLQSIQPDSEILPVLEEHIHSGERLSGTSTRREHAWPARRLGARRRSSILTREFQRSSSVMNLTKSICSTSPIRRSSGHASDEEEQNSQLLPDEAADNDAAPSDMSICSRSEASDEDKQNSQIIPADDAEEMENAEAIDNDAAQSYKPQATNIEDIIFEESEEEEEEEEIYDCEEVDAEPVYESSEEITINTSENRVTLHDITNILRSTKISTESKNNQEKIVKRRAPSRRIKTKNMNRKHNSSDENKQFEDNEDIDIIQAGRKVKPTSFATKSNEVTEEETLQEPRRCSNSRGYHDISKSFALNQNNGQITNNEVTLNSPTLVLNDMTLRNFKDVACSTPNSRQNSLEAKSTTTHYETSTTQISSNTSTRPSRRCKPKNLAEPQLGSKLRNESEIKPKKSSHKTKSKPKSKK